MTQMYERRSIGHVLEALRALGIPETIAGTVTVGGGEIKYHAEVFATYKYFDDIEQPLFNFKHPVYNQQKCVVNDGKPLTMRPSFRLTLSHHQTPGLIITGLLATQNLRQFIRGVMTNLSTDPCYEISQNAGAFFQGGYENANVDADPQVGYIYIEFWKPSGAQKFVDYINDNFKYFLEADGSIITDEEKIEALKNYKPKPQRLTSFKKSFIENMSYVFPDKQFDFTLDEEGMFVSEETNNLFKVYDKGRRYQLRVEPGLFILAKVSKTGELQLAKKPRVMNTVAKADSILNRMTKKHKETFVYLTLSNIGVGVVRQSMGIGPKDELKELKVTISDNLQIPKA